ncbi:MAG: hypothetical protein L3K13_08010 [Thermoplasmata archaeon]|nr:hypothetical protein [Thermoplasmata archaeon]
MPPLYLTCHACGREFASGLATSAVAAQALTGAGLLYRCVCCGVKDRYGREEFHPPPRALLRALISFLPPIPSEPAARAPTPPTIRPATSRPEGVARARRLEEYH